MEVTWLMNKVRKTKSPLIKGVCRKIAKYLGCYVGKNVAIGENVRFVHNALGTVIYTDTTIEDGVWIYQNVTLGKSDVKADNAKAHFVIRKNAILCAGAKLLCKPNETLEVGENSVVAANAVLLNSVPPNEMWGVPAKKLKSIDNSREKKDERI